MVEYHKYLVEEVHGAAQAEEGPQDALNHQDVHDHQQVAVHRLKRSRLVQDWHASHHKDQMVESSC